jgi:hypothetical protein
MNIEEFEKALTNKPAVARERPVPENTPITEWIDCPKSKAVLRYGYNEEKRILGVMWLNGTADTYLYENVDLYTFNVAKDAYSIGKYLKANMKYKRFTKVL